MNWDAGWFDDKEAVTFPAEIDMPHDISIMDACSIIPRSVLESVQEHLIVTCNLKVKCWEGECPDGHRCSETK